MSGLLRDEEMNLAILGDKSLAAPWVDTVLGVWADLGLDNHSA